MKKKKQKIKKSKAIKSIMKKDDNSQNESQIEE